MNFWESFRPDIELDCLSDLKLEDLPEKISGLMIDIDNTMTPHNGNFCNIPVPIYGWMLAIRDTIPICLASNNKYSSTVYKIAKKLKMPIVTTHLPDPFVIHILKTARMLHLKLRQMAVINDSYIFLGIAKMLGCLTIKVAPIDLEKERRESRILTAGRWIENRFIIPNLKVRQHQPVH